MRPGIPAAPPMTVWPADPEEAPPSVRKNQRQSAERAVVPLNGQNVPVSLVPPPCGACGTLAMRVTRVKASS
jgi:hypothetical protein